MTPRSRLHVPSPPARPGQEPDFSYVQISPAGAVGRPDVMAAPRDIETLSLQMVRVLGDDHRAVGPWNPHLEAPELQVALRHMLLTRLFDDRMQKIQRQVLDVAGCGHDIGARHSARRRDLHVAEIRLLSGTRGRGRNVQA